MKPFSQNFQVSTQHGDAINPKLAHKMAKTNVSSTNGDRKTQIKSTSNF